MVSWLVEFSAVLVNRYEVWHERVQPQDVLATVFSYAEREAEASGTPVVG